MDRHQVTFEWIVATEAAISELQAWLDALRGWGQYGGEMAPGDFDAAFDRLYKAGLGDTWADTCTAGGGLDALAEGVREGYWSQLEQCPLCRMSFPLFDRPGKQAHVGLCQRERAGAAAVQEAIR
jgi:hypothetical protein